MAQTEINFADRIREWRMSRNISQVELAKRADLNQSFISQIERGRVKEPSYTVLRHIATGLDLPVVTVLIGAGVLSREEAIYSGNETYDYLLEEMEKNREFQLQLEAMNGDRRQIMHDVVVLILGMLQTVARAQQEARSTN